MTVDQRIVQRLQDMLAAAERAARHVSGMDRELFLVNETAQDAVVHCLTIIGEASAAITRLDPTLADRFPTLSLQQSRGLRNRLVHDYLAINPERIWLTVSQDLPILRSNLKTVISELSRQP